MNTMEIEFNGEALFVIVDGLKIAKRGEPGTKHAGTWISIEPGWIVRDADSGGAIEVEYHDAGLQ